MSDSEASLSRARSEKTEAPENETRWLIAISALYAFLHSFDTIKAITRLLIRGEAWSGGDFPAFYATAIHSYRLGFSPYGTHESIHSTTGILSSFATTHPPFTILLFSPYAFIDITSAFILMTVINFLAAGAVFFYLYRMFVSNVKNRYLFVAIIGLLFWETISSSQNFARGQTNLIIAALLLFAWDSLRRNDRPMATGIALAVAALIKVYFAILLLPLVALRPRRILAAATTVAAVALLLSIVFFPAIGWSDWWNNVLPAAGLGKNVPGTGWAGSTLNHSINGLLTRNLGDPILIQGIGYPAILLIVVCSAWAIFRLTSTARRTAIDAGAPLLLAAIFLISPLSWVANYVFLWIAVLGAMENQRRSSADDWRLYSAFPGLLLIFCLPWPAFTFGKFEKYFGIIPTTAALVLWIICLIQALRIARRMSREPAEEALV